MPPDFRVISIGTLAAHPLWNEQTDVRTGHSTTTLITSGDARLVVDPGLPTTIVAARLGERSEFTPDEVTHVFLTSFIQDHYRGVMAFPSATWLVHEPERQSAAAALREQMERAEELADRELIQIVQGTIDLLDRCEPAEDSVLPGVDLFPLPGYTPGTCGLLLPLPMSTVLVCGDAVATSEHLARGAVLPTCQDVETAQESFREAIEIADLMVLGRDNLAVNPIRQAL